MTAAADPVVAALSALLDAPYGRLPGIPEARRMMDAVIDELYAVGRARGVLLDPPRAGAREQVLRIAASEVRRVVYVSCNPASWAKDARALADAGFRLAELRPIGQFRWSTHVELASLFLR